MMSTVSFGTEVSLKQAASLILATPQNRYLLQGEPGIGKSSLLKTLSESLPEHEVAYIDVPNMDLGDIAMPVIDRETKTTTYYPNSRFKVHTGKPVITMLDEFTKGADPIKNMLHPLLEVANPRLGDISVHPDSIVFLTGNLSSDGVGDHMKAHSRNRIIPLTVRKPDADEWLGWAVNNNIEPVVMAWVKQYPHALASYTDPTQGDNPYIYNPKKAQAAFVSPRSLERVSNIVRVRDQIDQDTLIAGMSGAVGESASRDLQAFVEYQDQLPTWESIVKGPDTCAVPDSVGACAVLVFGAITKVDKDTITSFMKYLGRFEPEWQACFAVNIAKTPSKQAIAFSSQAFSNWVTDNEDIL
jgi:energy-coupling factor transporter ATP-binding protein EcfA2